MRLGRVEARKDRVHFDLRKFDDDKPFLIGRSGLTRGWVGVTPSERTILAIAV